MLRPNRSNAVVSRRWRVPAAVVAAAVVLAAGPAVVAQQAPAADTAALFAPVAVGAGVPDAVAVSGLSVPQVAEGQPLSAVVSFAEEFTPPSGRWRVSVGVGDPAGQWVRASMLWDGTAAAGEALSLDGVLSTDLGAVDASVAADGTVTIGLPETMADGTAGDVVWVEAVLGEDADPTASMRSTWFARGALFGQGAPGLVPGGIYGVALDGERLPVGSGATDPAVVETGVPSVAELADGQLSVEVGSPPATVAGTEVDEVVDVITIADGTGAFDQSPQVRVNLTTGTVELAGVGGDTVVPADPSWLPVTLAGPVDPSSVAPAIAVDIDAAYAAVGLDPPGDGLAVAVSRLVRTVDGTEVIATGVAARRAWLDQAVATPLLPTTTAPPLAVATPQESDGPWVAIAVGVVVGVVAVAAAMVLAQARGRRRANQPVPPAAVWQPVDTPPQPPAAPSAPPVLEPQHPPAAGGVDDPGGEPDWGSAAPVAPDEPATAGDPAAVTATGDGDVAAPPEPAVADTADPYDYGATGDAGLPAAPAATPPPVDEALSAIDDDLAELARRLRRLDDDAS